MIAAQEDDEGEDDASESADEDKPAAKNVKKVDSCANTTEGS